MSNLIKELKSKFVTKHYSMSVSLADKELIKYFVQLTEPQKQSLLQMIKTFMNPGGELQNGISIEQYNHELDEVMNRISEGDFTTLEDLKKEMKTW